MSFTTWARTNIDKEVRRVYRSIKRKNHDKKSAALERKLACNNEDTFPKSTLETVQVPNKIVRRVEAPSNARHKLSTKLHFEAEPEFTTAASNCPTIHVRPLPKNIPHEPTSKYNCFASIEDPVFIPYLGDTDADHSSMLTREEIDKRKKATEEGPDMERDEVNEILDQVLLKCSVVQGIHVWKYPDTTRYAISALAQEACLTRERIQKRYKEIIVPMQSSENNQEVGRNDERNNKNNLRVETAHNRSNNAEQENSGDMSEKVYDKFDAEYLEVMDSYRVLYCQRCLTFSCSVHGLSYKSSLEFQQELAMEAYTKKQFPLLGVDTNSKLCFDDVTELTSFQKQMCKRAYIMHNGDFSRISTILGAPEHLIKEFVRENGFQLSTRSEKSSLKSRSNTKSNNYYSVKNYNQKWYKAIKDAEIHPFFVPCSHEGPCTEESCSCIQNRFFCTAACCWGALSPNYFRGCGCKGGCNASTCTCFAAKRECDPELCACCTCTDPPDKPVSKQVCRNDNIRMRRHAHLLLAPSEVSGWGCFTKHALKKGDFIHEYVGEMITQEVAEKRGQFDDAKDRSYLFNLTSDFVLDACRIGNKTRFINHSNKPNVETRTVFVNGDQHIGFFALEHIQAEEELFFDYRYNVSMSNELIEMAQFNPEWLSTEGYVKPQTKSNIRKRKGRKH